jgi:phospholipase/carboxylesterase
MTDNPHLTTEVLWSGASPRDARLVAIVLHGREQSPEIVLEMIGDRLGTDVAIAAPAAADRSWYPVSFLAPRAANEPRLGHALARVEALSRSIAAGGVARASQVVVGFSQGACLACEYAWTSACALAAVIAFTGGLIGPPGTTWQASAAVAGVPIWISGSEADPFVPAARMRETAEAFSRAGARAQLHLHPGTEHAVRDAELAGARALLAAIAA